MITITTPTSRITADTRADLARTIIAQIDATPAGNPHIALMRDRVMGRVEMPDTPAPVSNPDFDQSELAKAHRLRDLVVALDSDMDEEINDIYGPVAAADESLRDLAVLAWGSRHYPLEELPGVTGGEDGMWTVEGAGYVEKTEWGFVWKREHELLMDAQSMSRGFHRTLGDAVRELRRNA